MSSHKPKISGAKIFDKECMLIAKDLMAASKAIPERTLELREIYRSDGSDACVIKFQISVA
jgi:hypothetical protein